MRAETCGMLIIIAESYKGGRYGKAQGLAMWLLRSTRLSMDGGGQNLLMKTSSVRSYLS